MGTVWDLITGAAVSVILGDLIAIIVFLRTRMSCAHLA